MKDLQDTIQATPCDTVILGTPSDMSYIMDLGMPSVVAKYDLAVVPEHSEDFEKVLDSFYERYYHSHHHAA